MAPRGNNVDPKQALRNVAARNSLRMKTSKALHLVDKNSKSMVKLMQLQELAKLDSKGSLDKEGNVQAHIEILKQRINRRLLKLAKWVDLPEIERLPAPLPGTRGTNYALLLARQQQTAANQSRAQLQRQRLLQQQQQAQSQYSSSAVAAAVMNAAQLVATSGTSGASRAGAISSLPPVSALMPGVHIPISSLNAGQRAGGGDSGSGSVSISGAEVSSSVPVHVDSAAASSAPMDVSEEEGEEEEEQPSEEEENEDEGDEESPSESDE